MARAPAGSGSASRSAASGSASLRYSTPSASRRGAALRAALVVAALGVRVGRARVGGDELPAAELERHGLDRERLEVDPQRAALLAEQRRELVEQAGLGADPVVLDARAQLGQLDVGRAPRRPRRRAARGTARPRARPRSERPEPCAARRLDDRSRAGASSTPAAVELRHRAAHERAPAVGAARGRRAGTSSVSPRSMRHHLDAVAAQRLGGHRDAAVDRERQREPAVVVGVLADQVDAAGAARADASRPWLPGSSSSPPGRRAGGGRWGGFGGSGGGVLCGGAAAGAGVATTGAGAGGGGAGAGVDFGVVGRRTGVIRGCGASRRPAARRPCGAARSGRARAGRGPPARRRGPPSWSRASRSPWALRPRGPAGAPDRGLGLRALGVLRLGRGLRLGGPLRGRRSAVRAAWSLAIASATERCETVTGSPGS